ncbi:MAG: hypothetical protein RLZZ46_830 [Bacteroidota bacterium]|jgi:hypothetical protein
MKEQNKLNADYWRKRWQQGETGWDVGGASQPLLSFFETLMDKNQRILIPGAGNAWEAEFLFEKGFSQVHVLDIAPEAIDSFRQRNPAFPPNQIHQEDFFGHKGSYDLIVEQTFFCALQPDLRKAYAEKVLSLLSEGGRLAGVFFTTVPNAEGPPFGGSVEEYASYFNPLFRSVSIMPCLNSIKPREGRELFVELLK